MPEIKNKCTVPITCFRIGGQTRDLNNFAIFYQIPTFNTPKYSDSKIIVGSTAHVSGSEVKHGSYEVKVNIRGQLH